MKNKTATFLFFTLAALWFGATLAAFISSKAALAALAEERKRRTGMNNQSEANSLSRILRLAGETTTLVAHVQEFGLDYEVIVNGETQTYRATLVDHLEHIKMMAEICIKDLCRETPTEPCASERIECVTCGYAPCMCDQQ